MNSWAFFIACFCAANIGANLFHGDNFFKLLGWVFALVGWEYVRMLQERENIQK